MSKHVVVLGGGPAGLGTAWKLSKDSAEVDILEMDSQVGGLCKSTRQNGFIFDLGGHRFITNDNLLLAEIEELMGQELITRPRKSVVRLQNRFFEYPLEIVDVLKKINPAISLKCTFDFFLSRLGIYSKLADTSFEDWVIKRFGRTLYKIYFGPYSRKLWGVPSNQISSAWAAQRISLDNISDVILRMLGKEEDVPKTYARNFLYPRRGVGQICECMAEEIRKKGGRIHLGAKVKKIILKDNRIEKVIYIQDKSEKSISADFVVSTIPLPEFILGIQPKIETRYLNTAIDMKFRSIKFLHLMLDVEHLSHNTWMYVPEEKYLFFRIQDRRNWSSTVVPHEKNGLTLEIACNKDDAIWNASNEEIFERCMKDLKILGLVDRNAVFDYFVEKAEHAYPVYSIDYHQKVEAAYEFLSGVKDFIAIGRQGLFRYNNMDHSLKMGILAARHILYGYPKNKVLKIATGDQMFD